MCYLCIGLEFYSAGCMNTIKRSKQQTESVIPQTQSVFVVPIKAKIIKWDI